MTDMLVIDRGTGEAARVVDAPALLRAAGITDLQDAALLDLAGFDERARELEAITREARGQAGSEMIRRLDANAVWTAREGEYTITCPSPQAGTVTYDPGVLHAVLAAAVKHDAISQAAMDAAVKDVTSPPLVTYGLLRRISTALHGYLDEAADREVLDRVNYLLGDEPDPTYAVQTAGVNRLLKVGGEIAAAVKWCQVTSEPPRRTAKVKRTPVAA